MTHLTFVIPVRHPDNSPDLALQKMFLSETIASIAAQTEPGWRAVIVANHGVDLPDLPAEFSVEWVDFAPNPAHDITRYGKERARDAVRLDKGRRILSGMLAARDSSHFMIMDDDDFVSRDISAFVKAHPDAPGWYVETGFGWTKGSDFCVRMTGYSGVCGSSLIIRNDLYTLPDSVETADEKYIKDWLGSHVRIKGLLRQADTPLSPLPFDGGIYRVGHPNSHSNTSSIWTYFFLHPKYVMRPRKVLQHMRGLRRLDRSIKKTFFGTAV